MAQPQAQGAERQAVAPNRLQGSSFQLPPADRRILLSWETVSKTPRDLFRRRKRSSWLPRSYHTGQIFLRTATQVCSPTRPALHGCLLLLSLSQRMQVTVISRDCH